MINDKYLLQTKIQYNNDNYWQNIPRERNRLYSRKQTHENLKLKLNGQNYAIKQIDFRLIWNQTDVRLIPNQSENGVYNLVYV